MLAADGPSAGPARKRSSTLTIGVSRVRKEDVNTVVRDASDPQTGGVARRIVGGVDLLALHARNSLRYPHLLESAAHGTKQGRFDILFAFPGPSLVLSGGPNAALNGPFAEMGTKKFLAAFDRWWESERIAPAAPGDAQIPFAGGWFLYLGYELAVEIEAKLAPRFARHGADPDLPTALATRFPAAIVRDRLRDETVLVAEPGRESLLALMAEDLARAATAQAQWEGVPFEAALAEEDPRTYLAGVARIIDYIRAGDVYQVNLSRAWTGGIGREIPHGLIYERLRRSNPGPFAGLASWGDGAVISSSPERLVRVRGGLIETRPIAGTRPRGKDVAADDALRRELLAHPKERAEHVMLVDLERNDLARVTEPGSVRVDEYMVPESYAHVHHIVSNVQGRVRPEITPGRAIAAVFPGGTITGCPKLRCMEIVAELEAAPRGAYTGAMGYVNRDGSLDLNILIRTIVRAGARISLRAGAGIVADSIAERELEETRAKARGLILALRGV